uniref:Uncharacterized protein n=1 Tax=Haptolina ericina TaxID=156174 RepID=A0A7S3FJT7_9EUKA
MFDKWARSDLLQAVAAKIAVSRATDAMHAQPTLASAVRSLRAARHIATARSFSRRSHPRELPREQPEDERVKEVVRDASTLPNANRLPRPGAPEKCELQSSTGRRNSSRMELAADMHREKSTRERPPSRRRSAERPGGPGAKRPVGKSFVFPTLPSLPSARGDKPSARGDKPSARGSRGLGNGHKPIITPRARTPDPTTPRSALWCKHLRELSTARSTATTARGTASTARKTSGVKPTTDGKPEGLVPQRPGRCSSLQRCGSFLQELIQDVERDSIKSRRERAPSTRRGSSIDMKQGASTRARREMSRDAGELVTI